MADIRDVVNFGGTGGSGGGLLPRIMISATPGVTVTCTLDSESLEASEVSSGVYRCDVPDYGVWTVTCILDDTPYFMQTVSVDVVKVYSVSTGFSFYGYWLYLAGIPDTFGSLSAVLQDAGALQILMSVNSCVDYLVTQTGWISQVCSSQLALRYAGINAYCREELFKVETWRIGIANSQYVTEFLPVTVPTIKSSNNRVVSRTNYINSNYAAWKVFDKTLTDIYDSWICQESATMGDCYVGYIFDNPVVVPFVEVYNQTGGVSPRAIKDCKIQASDDGASWIDVKFFTNSNNNRDSRWIITFPFITTPHLYWRITCLTSNDSSKYIIIGRLQFYGREV